MTLFSIPADLHGVRLDRALSHHPLIRTRSRAARLIEQGQVWLNAKKAKASYPVQTGEVFEIHLPEAESESELKPLSLQLDILFEDSDVIVVNKPAGLVIHPAAGHSQDTLVNALIHHTSELSMGFGEKRPGIVHRLDKNTSGVLVVAKNDSAHERLSLQFRERSVHRLYWAVVVGVPRNSQGLIESRLARHPGDRKKFASVRLRSGEASSTGKLAVTHYKVWQKSASGLSLLQLKLQTGRTHQIRVHLSEMGHPIVGDQTYGAHLRRLPSQNLRNLVESLRRFALHAYELGFKHPSTGEWMSFQVPCPDELKPLIEASGFQL